MLVSIGPAQPPTLINDSVIVIWDCNCDSVAERRILDGEMSSSSSSEIPFFFTHIFSWAVTLIGARFVWKSMAGCVRAIASARWPTIEGRVLSCALESHSVNEDGAEIKYPKIEYHYSVGGVKHSSSHISVADFSHTGEAAESFVARHPKGQRVVVHYDPTNPAQSLLEPGVRPQTVVAMCFSFVLFAFGTMLIYIFKAWR